MLMRWRQPDAADDNHPGGDGRVLQLPAGTDAGDQTVTGRAALARRAGEAHSDEAHRARRATIRELVHRRLIDEINRFGQLPDAAVAQRIGELVDLIVVERKMVVNREERRRIATMVSDEVLGLGPLEELLADQSISEIMVNGPDRIYVERNGHVERAELGFDGTGQLRQVIDRIVRSVGRRIDESSPMVDARLADGSRVNVVIPPLALTGPTITIRRFGVDHRRFSDLLANGTIDEQMLSFLAACVRARLNVIVSGGTGSGKTTLLNVLSAFCDDDERIVTIEDAAELQLRQRHVVPLETRPANAEGRGHVGVRELVINALRMRPDRIVVGECRGAEALDMLQAMNTGHDGSLSTVHANSAKDAVARLETLVLMSGVDMPSRAVREQIAAAVQIIVHVARLRDGSRRVTSISEVTGVQDGRVVLQEIFRFRQRGLDGDGRIRGEHVATGAVPECLERVLMENGGRFPRVEDLDDSPVDWEAADGELELVGAPTGLDLLPGEEALLSSEALETLAP